MKFLEELWYGNIEPTGYGASFDRENKEALHRIVNNEEKLLATMTDEQKAIFSCYDECVRKFQAITDCMLFQNSFKLGARMMLEVIGE